MLSAFLNVFKVPDIRKRLLFTLGIIIVYRIGSFIPVPGIDGKLLAMFFARLSQTGGGTLFGMMNMFSGGAMARATIFALGIMPYISASIILQLLTVVIPALEKMAKEGAEGRKKITQYTRFATLGLSIIQAFFIALYLEHMRLDTGVAIVQMSGWLFRIITVITLASGTAFIMWLGEQITEKGIGNGMSLIITAGIVSRMPVAFSQLITLLSPFDSSQRHISFLTVGIMSAIGIAVIIGIVIITQGQRKIPVQYAKRIVGRRMYGGQSTYIPIRVNHAGVIPIIFAQSIILFPATIAGFVKSPLLQAIAQTLTRGNLLYVIIYGGLIIFFAYFYTAITFNPVEIADNMKKYGGFVPGIRPGKSTAEFFAKILDRVTLPGAIFLAIIAVMPTLFSAWFKIPYLIASFFGGTGLLIVVGVMLDTVRQLESQLVMRNYDGFMKHGRVKGRR